MVPRSDVASNAQEKIPVVGLAGRKFYIVNPDARQFKCIHKSHITILALIDLRNIYLIVEKRKICLCVKHLRLFS